HHAIISGALGSALRQDLVHRNVAKLVDNRPAAKDTREDTSLDAAVHCWSADEARRVLEAAKTISAQMSALYALALDTGARKGELCALRWSDVDLDTGTLTFERTLLRGVSDKGEPTFGRLKNPKRGNPRIRKMPVNAETVERLREHKRQQAELKMKNRIVYKEYGLVFAKEWGDLHGRKDSLGKPLAMHNFGEREHARVIEAAGVRRIKFHGTRHTAATLMLASGVPVHEVAARLGHKDASVTLGVYAHVSERSQVEAARRLGEVLFGSGKQ
ncbi:MAG TPA: site-specific integrase, partial [Vicinamibacterales bacterium]